MDKLKVTGQNLGRFFKSKSGCAYLCHAFTKIAYLKVENLAQTTYFPLAIPHLC